MSLNYKADKVTFPSVRGVERSDGKAASVVGGSGCATAFNVTAASQNVTLPAAYLSKWLTIQANGCTLYLVFGAVGDTTTAAATGAVLKLTDGQMVQGMVTADTQQIGVISTGNFTGGMVYWASARDS